MNSLLNNSLADTKIYPSIIRLEKTLANSKPYIKRYVAKYISEYHLKIKLIKNRMSLIDKKDIIYFITLITNDFLTRHLQAKLDKEIVISLNSYIRGKYRNEIKSLN